MLARMNLLDWDYSSGDDSSLLVHADLAISSNYALIVSTNTPNS